MRAAFLEAHSEFEGVGAHELNVRYDHVDEGDGYSTRMRVADASTVPAFVAARTDLVMGLITVRPRLDGVDVAHYQYDSGPLNWATVAAIPTWWAATKLTQSTTYADPTGQRSRMAFLAAGMTHRGLYHWLSSTTDPAEQAAKFLRELGPVAVGEFAMLDAEEAGITTAGALTWCETVEAVTHRPAVVYSGAYVTGGTIWQSTKLRESKYGRRPFILAAYTTEAKALALPGVRAYPWQAWQFSSNGPVPGVVGRCDMDRVDDRAAFDTACGFTAHTTPIEVQPSPTPQGDDMPAVFTNAEAHSLDGASYGPGVVKWVVMPDGSKRHIGGVEAAVYGTPAGVALTNEQIGQLPDYVAATSGTTGPRSGTWSET